MPPTVWDSFNPFFRINDRQVGGDAPCYIIAEAGVSHFGDMNKALLLVDAAVNAGADAVKFQHFKVEAMISSSCSEWVERMRPKQLRIEDFSKIQDYCKRSGITFFASAHDEPSLRELALLDIPCFKIGSGELGNLSYYQLAASFKKPIIASTGMHSRLDLEFLLKTLQQASCHKLALLHCITAYPTPPSECHLKMIQTLSSFFSGPVGYSDHSVTQDIAASTVLLGAKIIERHLTLEKNIENAQDWKVSCLPEELIEFVASIRRLESALGNGTFQDRSPKEKQNMLWATKSLVAKKDIPLGAFLTADDLEIKRPGTGIPPSELTKVIGARTLVTLHRDSVIKPEMIEEKPR